MRLNARSFLLFFFFFAKLFEYESFKYKSVFNLEIFEKIKPILMIICK